ncbi:Uncharacterized protein MA16_Dca028196 [Dendrobium catenatum]|uniref:Succinate dehydrogenase subunit 5, mitochondrial n=1 Tax=Dendrobium catenatum TaxID=906689 RepID=A0A2I0VG66_9ASPA|nr:Uncharacterized protein MA16_Dca028196 [Dendrobium catenatum]
MYRKSGQQPMEDTKLRCYRCSCRHREDSKLKPGEALNISFLVPCNLDSSSLFRANLDSHGVGWNSWTAHKKLVEHHGRTSINSSRSNLGLISFLDGELSCYLPFGASFKRDFSATAASQLPAITDPDIKVAFKDLMALNWNEVPDSLVNETTKALSKTTDDVSGEEALANAFRAAEASVEFGSTLVSLRMALDDLGGLTGENVGNLPDGLDDAIEAAYRRYKTYLDSFGPDEVYLRKKVEIELGTKMIHIKMRCSGIGSEWGKLSSRYANRLLQFSFSDPDCHNFCVNTGL